MQRDLGPLSRRTEFADIVKVAAGGLSPQALWPWLGCQELLGSTEINDAPLCPGPLCPCWAPRLSCWLGNLACPQLGL